MRTGKHLAKGRKKPKWKGAVLALVVLTAAVYAGFHVFMQSPQLREDEPGQDEAFSQQDAQSAAEAEALRSHRERKEGFYTILLSGVDNHAGGSDTNILVAVDSKGGAIYGVSIPRDTKAVIKGTDHKINYAYNAGGMELMAQTVSDQLGIPVDYTVQVDLQGFVSVVDAIGGVEFDVPVDMDYEDPYQDLYIHIPKGLQTLNGEDALKVVRFRSGYATQDIGRMQTQQAFLKAAAKQTLTLSNLDKVDDFVKIFQSSVETDLTLGNLAWLGKEAIRMGAEAVNFSTLPGEWSGADNYIHLNPEETLTLINEHLNPYVEDRVPEDLNIPN